MDRKILLNFGFNDIQINKIFNLGHDRLHIPESKLLFTIKNSLNALLNLNIDPEEIIRLVDLYPDILFYSQTKYNYIISLLYNYFNPNEIRNIFRNYPNIISGDIEKLFYKLEIFRENNLLALIALKPKNLIQSAALDYARIEFLKENKCSLEENYTFIFYSQKEFIKKFNITNEDLLDKYPYNQIKKVK